MTTAEGATDVGRAVAGVMITARAATAESEKMDSFMVSRRKVLVMDGERGNWLRDKIDEINKKKARQGGGRVLYVRKVGSRPRSGELIAPVNQPMRGKVLVHASPGMVYERYREYCIN